jgi:FkbM family methyltransferase
LKLVDGWYITDADAAIRAHPVRRQTAKDLRVISVALKHVDCRQLVIQAGARIGLWPSVLAEHFKKVIAFEPETRNVECARANTSHLWNVEIRHAALGKEPGRMAVEHSLVQSGSHQIVTEGGNEPCDVETIDSLNVTPDAIFLDIEGFELFALQGALETLKRCSPLLVLEMNDSRLRYGVEKSQIVDLLKPFGYAAVDRCGKDIVYRA